VVVLLVSTLRGCFLHGSISGHISNTNGTAPTSKVLVCCLAKSPYVNITYGDPAPPYLVVESGANFKFDNLPFGDYDLWVINRSDNSFSNGILSVNVSLGQEANANFILLPGGSVSGHVLDQNGQSISSTVYLGYLHKVRVTCENQTMGSTVFVSEDGSYYFGNLMPGKYRIMVNIDVHTLYGDIIIESNKTAIHDFSFDKTGFYQN